MQLPITPANESDRIDALKSYSILDSLPEKEYDDITLIASQICQIPISLISLIDEDRQWFKSKQGLDAPQTPRGLAFCAHAINEPDEILIVKDARKDVRFSDNPLVIGDPRVIFYTGIPLVNPQGFPLGTLCVIDNKPHELTDIQLKTLKSLANQVVNLLELRKSKMALEQLNKVLEHRNEALDQFARMAAHDIKSPLNQMILLTGFISQKNSDGLNPEVKELIDLIKSSSLKLKSLVDGILEFSKNENILRENKENIHLETFLKETINLIDHQNDCKFLYPNSDRYLLTNKVALRQIFLNLISNGIKYNDKDQVEIKIDFYESDEFYNFSVKDNGKGIEEKFQDKIFETFRVLDIKDRFGNRGNGLGLSTVKKLIEGLGGTINVVSTPKSGSNFMFSLRK